jgi:hypothetical protein
MNGVRALEQGKWYGGVGRLEGRSGGGGALVVGAVGPVEGLDDLFDVFELLLTGRSERL